ncbi:hypothetical protein GQ53DRAFT_293381 [Thozetella sp. PMI_491]|nr:hypothetical protein GQ53DRAFT_293381 [Thozetella sp. PMI_491]
MTATRDWIIRCVGEQKKMRRGCVGEAPRGHVGRLRKWLASRLGRRRRKTHLPTARGKPPVPPGSLRQDEVWLWSPSFCITEEGPKFSAHSPAAP